MSSCQQIIGNQQNRGLVGGLDQQITKINSLFNQMNLSSNQHKRTITSESIETPIYEVPVKPQPKEKITMSEFQKYLQRKEESNKSPCPINVAKVPPNKPPRSIVNLSINNPMNRLQKIQTETSLYNASSRSILQQTNSNVQLSKILSQRDMSKAQKNKEIIEQAYETFVEKKQSKSPITKNNNLTAQLKNIFKHKFNLLVKPSMTPEQSKRSNQSTTVKKNYFAQQQQQQQQYQQQ